MGVIRWQCVPISWSLQSNSVGALGAGEARCGQLMPSVQMLHGVPEPTRRALSREKKRVQGLWGIYIRNSSVWIQPWRVAPHQTAETKSRPRSHQPPPRSARPNLLMAQILSKSPHGNHILLQSNLGSCQTVAILKVAGLRASGYSGSMFCCWQCNPPSAT